MPSAGVFHAPDHALEPCMSNTIQFDKLLTEAEAAAAKQPNPAAVEHVVLAMLRKAKTDPQLAGDLARLYPSAPPPSPARG